MGEGPRKRSLTGGKPISRSLVGGKSRKRRKKIKQKKKAPGGKAWCFLIVQIWGQRECGCENVGAR